ncbi:MAG: DsbA family protein, partial [Pseudomonadales bacterium]|nr:DsbA family protein [Pseudomonadales bacterium]
MASRKTEQRKFNKEEKQKQALRRQRMADWGFKAALAVLIPLVLIVLWQGWSSGTAALPPEEVGAADHVMGNAAAGLTLTVYADFQCPACKAEEQIIARAWPRIANQVQLVFRHYPLDGHRHAFLAARYAEAAARQGKFWQLHDQLFATQELWSNIEDAQPLFDAYAQEAGLDLAQLKADIDLPEVRGKILSDQRGGIRAGVSATPSLFLNGRLLRNNPGSVSELVALIEGA